MRRGPAGRRKIGAGLGAPPLDSFSPRGSVLPAETPEARAFLNHLGELGLGLAKFPLRLLSSVVPSRSAPARQLW